MNAKDISTKDIKLNVLAYGKSGTGKTTFACTFPSPIYVFDFDNGMLSQRGKDVDYDTYDDYGKFEAKLGEIEREGKYATLVIDSITTMQDYIMDRVLLLARKTTPTLHEWLLLMNSMRDLFMRMTKMNNHLVVVAHEQLMQDEITGEVLIRPLIVGKKLPEQLALWFDECYRCQVVRDDKGAYLYRLATRADTKCMAKSRLMVLDDLEVPDFNVIIRKASEFVVALPEKYSFKIENPIKVVSKEKNETIKNNGGGDAAQK